MEIISKTPRKPHLVVIKGGKEEALKRDSDAKVPIHTTIIPSFGMLEGREIADLAGESMGDEGYEKAREQLEENPEVYRHYSEQGHVRKPKPALWLGPEGQVYMRNKRILEDKRVQKRLKDS